jgi:hypothetical protein
VWPVPRSLRAETVRDGIDGVERATLGGIAGAARGRRRVTPAGHRVEIVDEIERYAHMRAADVALTIPGTNTLELGIAGVPAVVVLPLNRPEIIPLEGRGTGCRCCPSSACRSSGARCGSSSSGCATRCRCRTSSPARP